MKGLYLKKNGYVLDMTINFMFVFDQQELSKKQDRKYEHSHLQPFELESVVTTVAIFYFERFSKWQPHS